MTGPVSVAPGHGEIRVADLPRRTGGRKRGGGRGGAERSMVPEAEFHSYYGRPVVKASPWRIEIPAYLFLGGVAAGSLTLEGVAGTVLLGSRSRPAAVASGAALVAGSACLRFGVFEAGQVSARDPRYTVVPQRERVAARSGAQHPDGGPR